MHNVQGESCAPSTSCRKPKVLGPTCPRSLSTKALPFTKTHLHDNRSPCNATIATRLQHHFGGRTMRENCLQCVSLTTLSFLFQFTSFTSSCGLYYKLHGS